MAGPWETYAQANESAAPWEQYADTGERALPKGVAPSAVEGGRGSAADPRRTDAPAAPEAPAFSDPSGAGDGAAIMNSGGPARSSVLEGIQMDAPVTNTDENVRLSNRVYAEDSAVVRKPGPAASRIDGKTIPVNNSGTLSRAADLVGSQIDSYAAGLGYRAGDAAALVGADKAAANLRGRASNLQERSDTTSQSVSLSADGAFEKYAPQILAVFPTMAVAAASGGLPVMFGVAELQQYAEGRKAGLNPMMALGRSVPMGAAEVIGEKLGGTGKLLEALEKAAVKGGSIESLKELSGRLAASGMREIPSEEATYAMQFGIDKAPGIGLKPDAGVSDFMEGAKDTAIVAAGAGGVMAGASMGASRLARIKQLRDAGETGVADFLQTKHDKQSAIEAVDGELNAMPGNEAFQGHYRNLRTAGIKPAEAAARAATTTVFGQIGEQAGMPQKAVDAALQKASTLPVDQVPAFLDKYTKALTARGMAQPFDGIDQLGASLEAARDEAIDAAMGAAYSQGDVRKAMDDVLALEKNSAPGADLIKTQPAAQEERAPAAIENVAPATQEASIPEGQRNPTTRGMDIARKLTADIDRTAPESERARMFALEAQRIRDTVERVQATPDIAEAYAQAADVLDEQARFYSQQTQQQEINAQNQGIDPGVSRETPAPDAVPAGAAAGNAGQPVGNSALLASGGTEPGPEALNGVLRDTNPQAGTAAQAEAAPGQAAEVGAVDAAGIAPTRDAAGAGSVQANGLNEPVAQANSAQAAIETVAPQTENKVGRKDSAQIAQPDSVVQTGRDNIPLTEGGKPFKTKQAADTARKGQTTMRTVRVEGGFALADKTEAQMAAQDKNARRLALPQTSPRGEAIPAHAFIAAEGGLSPFERADMGMEGNVAIGNRKLFAGAGKGLSIERATEKLVEEGYLQEHDHQKARDLIKRSLTKPQYTPEGTEMMAEKQAQADFDAAQAEQDAIAKIESNTDNQFAVVEALLDDAPDFDAPSNMSEADAMRAMGFTEQEISDAVTASRQDQPQGDSRDGGNPAARAEGSPSGDSEPGIQAPREDQAGRSQEVEAKAAPAQTDAAPAAITFALRDSGSLAVKGNPQAIRDKLKGITKMSPMEGGMMVGKTQAQRAIDILSDKPAEAVAARPLSVGITPATAEAVTVKDGKVFIGPNEAVNFDSGDAVSVKPNASDAEIVRALKDAGALSRRQKVFGLQDAAQNQTDAQENSDKPAPDALKSAPDLEAKPERNDALIELRKRESVLKALIKCMGG